MWEGVTPVAIGYDPIVSESPIPVKVIVFNAGPGVVELKAWDIRKPDDGVDPDSKMEVRSGETRAVWGALVRVKLLEVNESSSVTGKTPSKFSAVGWRCGGTMMWSIP